VVGGKVWPPSRPIAITKQGTCKVTAMHGDDIIKAAVLNLLFRGEVTVSEAARLAKTSRQKIDYWAKVEEIDPMEHRSRLLSTAWNAAIRTAKNGTKVRKGMITETSSKGFYCPKGDHMMPPGSTICWVTSNRQTQGWCLDCAQTLK